MGDWGQIFFLHFSRTDLQSFPSRAEPIVIIALGDWGQIFSLHFSRTDLYSFPSRAKTIVIIALWVR